MFNVPPTPPAVRVRSRLQLNSIHTQRTMSCVTEFTAVVIWFLGRPKLLVQTVHKLFVLRTPTRKSSRVWDQEISGARTEAPGLLSRRDLFIVEVEIHSENVQHPGASGVQRSGSVIWKFRTSSFKCYVDHSHTMYSSGNIEVRNWVNLFESRCIVEPGSPQMTLWRMSVACCILKATNTHS